MEPLNKLLHEVSVMTLGVNKNMREGTREDTGDSHKIISYS
jgi:hypothetical protein